MARVARPTATAGAKALAALRAVGRPLGREDDPEALTWANVRRAWQAYLLLAPIFLLLAVFNYYPPIVGLFRAFYEWRPIGSQAYATFVGLRNFQAYFAHPEMPRELVNSVKLLSGGAVTRVLVPLLAAEMLFAVRHEVAKNAYRLAIVLPLLAPTVVSTLVWGHIYDPRFGALSEALRAVGLGALAPDWLGDPRVALYSVIGVGFPWMAGIATLIYLGALGQISSSLFDAALVDGCTGLKRVLLIDLPLMMGQVRTLAVLAVVNALSAFQVIYILTLGGPGYATMVPALSMYEQAITYGMFGYASAIGCLLFVLTMGLTLLINTVLRKSTY